MTKIKLYNKTNGKPITGKIGLKGFKGVYFVTSNNPKDVDTDAPFIVRVGKADGKEGIYGRIATHQGSNFDKLYFSVLTRSNCPQAYEEHGTPTKLEKYIHKIFREDENIVNRDSWYEFVNLQHFLRTVESHWFSFPIVVQEEVKELANFSELMNEYKYTNTQISFDMFRDIDKNGHRYRIPSNFEWFCTAPVQKKPIRGIVFKEGVVYEEYFSGFNEGVAQMEEYQEIVGGYFYMKRTEHLLAIDPQAEWEDIVIIGKEQNEIKEETPFMMMQRSKHYVDQSTPPGDTLIVLGGKVIPDHGSIECSLKKDLGQYNFFMDYPCFHITINNGEEKTQRRKFQYRPYNENLTEEGVAYYAFMEKRLKEIEYSGGKYD